MAERIVYLSWPAKEIAGGIKLAFQHVEVLRQAGIEAVIATPDGQPPGWFQTEVPVLNVADLRSDEDVLVFPENHRDLLRRFAKHPNRKLVFCQNPFMAFRGLAGAKDYGDYGVTAILCEGRLTAEFCQRRFPSMPIAVVPVAIDQRLFHFQAEKRMQIAFAPRKRPLEAAFIRDLFRAENPEFRSVPWVEISGVSEQQVARILKDSAVYLSLSRFESVSLSILEAMACGCVVAGFTGFGAREFATTQNGFWAGEDDCLECASQLARAVRLVSQGGSLHSGMLEAAHLAAGHYSRERFASKVVGFWRSYLGNGQSPG
ncbi:MAG TPA: glycosyltransferase [Thermoguttaceae bacterium]|nr:glycosyltransferase [Thermoguttaceae bacterium]